MIYKLPLRNAPEAGIDSMAMPDILGVLIIGPSDTPRAVRDAFVHFLFDANISDPERRGRMSDIPMR